MQNGHTVTDFKMSCVTQKNQNALYTQLASITLKNDWHTELLSMKMRCHTDTKLLNAIEYTEMDMFTKNTNFKCTSFFWFSDFTLFYYVRAGPFWAAEPCEWVLYTYSKICVFSYGSYL